MDFLTGRSQVVTIGSNTSSTLVQSSPECYKAAATAHGCTLFTHDCSAIHGSHQIIKFADDTKDIDLISNDDETEYRDEVTRWCKDNSLALNVSKTKELFVVRNHQGTHSSTLDRTLVEIVSCFPFTDLGRRSVDPQHGRHAQEGTPVPLPPTVPQEVQHKHTMACELLLWHHSVRSGGVTVWYGNTTAQDRKAIQRFVRMAEKIIGCALPSIEELFQTRCRQKASSIIKDHYHRGTSCFPACSPVTSSAAFKLGQASSRTVSTHRQCAY